MKSLEIQKKRQDNNCIDLDSDTLCSVDYWYTLFTECQVLILHEDAGQFGVNQKQLSEKLKSHGIDNILYGGQGQVDTTASDWGVSMACQWNEVMKQSAAVVIPVTHAIMSNRYSTEINNLIFMAIGVGKHEGKLLVTLCGPEITPGDVLQFSFLLHSCSRQRSLCFLKDTNIDAIADLIRQLVRHDEAGYRLQRPVECNYHSVWQNQVDSLQSLRDQCLAASRARESADTDSVWGDSWTVLGYITRGLIGHFIRAELPEEMLTATELSFLKSQDTKWKEQADLGLRHGFGEDCEGTWKLEETYGIVAQCLGRCLDTTGLSEQEASIYDRLIHELKREVGQHMKTICRIIEDQARGQWRELKEAAGYVYRKLEQLKAELYGNTQIRPGLFQLTVTAVGLFVQFLSEHVTAECDRFSFPSCLFYCYLLETLY